MSPPSATEAVETRLPIPTSEKAQLANPQPDPSSEADPSIFRKTEGQAIPRPPKFTDKYEERQYQKARLALAFRIFAKNGFDEGVAGHITLRDPVDPETFWLNPFGVAWPLLKASDLIRVNAEGKVIDGGPCRLLNAAAFMIHHAVHTARPEINCVAHSHSTYGRAFSTLGRNLDIITQDSCSFYNDIVLYSAFRGIVLDEEEGIAIAKALGKKKAAILQNHGLLTCGRTIESTVFWFMNLEKCCQVQLMADAAAGGKGAETVKIDEADAAFTYKSVGSELVGWFAAKPAFDMAEHAAGLDYKW